MSAVSLSYTTRDWINLTALVAAETALLWLTANILLMPLDQTHSGMPPAVAILLMVSAAFLPRALHDMGIWGGAFSAVMIAAIAGSTLLAVWRLCFAEVAFSEREWLAQALQSLIWRPSDVVLSVWPVVILSALIWWRGVTRPRPDIDAALLLFKGGAVVLAVVTVLHALMKHGLSDRQASAAVIVFFTGTLLGIAMLRQDIVPLDSGQRWLETIILPVVAIVVPAALIVGLLASDLSGMIELLVDPIIWLLTLVLRVIAFVLIVIALAMLIPLIWLFSHLPFSDPDPNQESSSQTARNVVSAASDRVMELPDLFRYVVAAGALVLLFAGIARFRLRIGFTAEDAERGIESTRVEGSLFDDLRAWLGGFGRNRGAVESDPLAALRGDPRWQHTVAIREQYADLLRWTQQRGVVRRAAMTPDELAARWDADATAAEHGAIARLTSIYDRARYGEEPATARDAQEAAEIWGRLTTGAAGEHGA